MKKLILLLLFFANIQIANCQQEPIRDLNGKTLNVFKFQATFLLGNKKICKIKPANLGEFLSLGYGINYYKNNTHTGLNLALSARLGKNNLGNRNQATNRWQLNAVVSPVFTMGFSNCRGYLEEINPNYFGIVSCLYSDFRSEASIGTDFVVMPRGIKKNITTNRNRTQQLGFIHFKGGWGKVENANKGSFQINLYEDFLGFTDNAFGQVFADNFDRFFTGGANMQLRLNDKSKLNYYNEIYTGNMKRESFDYPDWVTESVNRKENNWALASKFKRLARYAYQDAGQQLFNRGRSFIVVELGNNSNYIENCFSKPVYQVIVGMQRKNSMWTQNFIHSSTPIEKKLCTDDTTIISKNKDKDRLHLFYPNYDKSDEYIFIGGSILYSKF